ncbi:MAG: pitrilysin family protein [Patescibacteria group bacterium]
MFTHYQLQNNARIILVPQHDTKSLTTLIMYPVGSRYEPEKLSGVSHYVEHLMFKGTKKRKNTLILTREIDRLGAEYNAFTSKEHTGYYIKADGSYADIALDILSDMLFNSTFDPKEMEREKGPIIEELRMYRDNPLMNIDTIFENLMYDGCPLGRDIGGTDDHVRSYQRPDVLAYRDKYYDASNMTVVIAGAVTEEVRRLVEKYIGSQGKSVKPGQAYKPAAFGSRAKADRIVVQKKKTDQVQLMLGFPGFNHTAPQDSTLAVLNTILGGSMSSRLFIQIRERRGLAYMIRSGAEHFRDTGYVFVRAGLEAKNINKAMSVVVNELDKMKTKPVTPRELADAKTHIRGALTLTMEDSSAQANWYAKEALFMEEIQTPEERLKSVDTVTASDVQHLAREIFKMGEMRVAVIGDVERLAIRV